jgi:ubiquinone/menaquinone biosynthesis C-methylase UbiE
MSDKPTIDAYNKIAEEFAARNSVSMYDEEFSAFCSLLKSGDTILEIGCGTGRDADELLKRGLHYTGIDASEEMLAVARARVPDGKFQVGDFYHLDFLNGTFDGFWAAASFLHVPKKDIDSVLREARRILKPNGVGFISLKQKTVMDEGYIKESKAGGIERYFAFYDKDEITGILERNKFEVAQMTTRIEHDGTVWLCCLVRRQEMV